MTRRFARGGVSGLALSIAIGTMLVGAAASADAATLQAPGGGRVFAFVLGADEYEHFNNLHGAVADAEDIAGALKRAGVDNIALFKDKDDPKAAIPAKLATRDAVVGEMNHLVATVQAGDFVLITFSGHGNRIPELAIWKGIEGDGFNEEFVLPGYDSQGPGTKEVIMNKEMKAWLSRLDGKGADVLLIADTCFGGGLSRGVDFRGNAPVYRVLRGKAPGAGGQAKTTTPASNQFEPIPISPKELRASVSDLKRVTAIAGGDKHHLVPEISIPNVPTPRGALSYSVARAIEGRAADKSNGVTTRYSLLGYALQIVQQYSDGNQLLDRQPDTDDEGVLARPLFRSSQAVAAPETPDVPAVPDAEPPVRVGVLGGDASSVEGLPKGISPFVAVDDTKQADLIWDPARKEVIQGGDVIKQNVEPQEISGIVDRTRVLADLKKLSESRVQTIDLRDGGKRYTPASCEAGPSGCPHIEVRGVQGQNLIVFNIAAEGRIQRLRPIGREASQTNEDVWRSSFNVVAPFGSDSVVAIVSGQRLPNLEAWLQEHEQKSDAGLLLDQVKEAIKVDPALKLGLVGVYTGP